MKDKLHLKEWLVCYYGSVADYTYISELYLTSVHHLDVF